jgi:hypothetical protein
MAKAKKKAKHKAPKTTATSKKGVKYKRSATSKTGWVAVKGYDRAKPKRKGACGKTRTARSKNRKWLSKSH